MAESIGETDPWKTGSTGGGDVVARADRDGDGPCHQRLHRRLVGGVGRHRQRLRRPGLARGGGDLLQVLGGARPQHHGGARLGQGQCRLPADAAAGPDEQRGPTVQTKPLQ